MKNLFAFLLALISSTGYAQTTIQLDSTNYKSKPMDCFSGSHPLYVVDNKIFPCDSIKFINADDIEAITIYKGLEAQTLYGTAGSRNGTVAITTKKHAALKNRDSKEDGIEKP